MSEPAHKLSANVFHLRDGSAALVDETAVEIRDAEDRLVFRYEDGHLELIAPSGDVALRAPRGEVSLEGRTVSMRAQEESVALGVAGTRVVSTALDVKAGNAVVATPVARLVADAVSTSAKRVALDVEQYELAADRMVQRARSAVTEVREAWHTRAGRWQAMVNATFSLRSKRSVMTSVDDTSIDGRRILLG